jgi:7-cyano-7-deazaguanine synthase
MKEKAVVLLSGGLDSTTALAIAVARGLDVYPLSVEYGQRHRVELERAQAIAAHYGRPHATVSVRFGEAIQGSALTDEIEVPKDRPMDEMADGIPVTYVPARNTFLLGLAASYAEQLGARFVYVGFNALDYSGYPDCRPEYVKHYNRALLLGLEQVVQVIAPIIRMRKTAIVRKALALGAPLHLTWSCYSGDGGAGEAPCGRCDSCRIRSAAFAELGQADPAVPR